MNKKTTLWLAGGLLLLLLLVGMGLWLMERHDARPREESQTVERTEEGAIILPLDGGEQTKAPARGAARETNAPATVPPRRDPMLPERETRVTAAYFADTAFVGNETVMCLERYDYDGLLTKASFFEVDSVNGYGYVAHMKQDGAVYGKVYIGLGGAELACRVDDLRQSIGSAIDAMRDAWPDCVVVLMSVSPVSKYRTDVSQAIRMDRLPEYNAMLYDLAAEKDAWYLNVTDCLVGEDGYLPSEVTEDGINYTPGHYQGWYDQLALHYTGDPK